MKSPALRRRVAQPRDQDPGLRQDAHQGMMDGDCVIADEETHSTREPHPGQGSDERLNLEVGDEPAHDRAERHAHQEHEKDDQPAVPSIPQHSGRRHRRQGNHAADRKVDPAGEDHQGHPDGADQEIAVVGQDVEEDLGITHPGVEERPEQIRRGRQAGGRQKGDEALVSGDQGGCPLGHGAASCLVPSRRSRDLAWSE